MLKALITGVAAGVTYLDCVGYVARVDGLSMQPALNPSDVSPDYVYLSRWSIRNFSVTRGDIVSLTSPKDPEQRIIKRVIALQGDVVSTSSYKAPVVKVPDGHCWVEGDHKALSFDSNYFGPVPVGLMTAKATHIVWPPKRWQKLRSHIPKARSPKTFSNQGRI